eukprot:TRINITY_DN22277_c0_g1_i1.p1 TRINITY_DN22277_c0_g1~~TRINITY_DN22277_c0_g1_i1.p1  ORF type:complete len:375 (-),score=65.93 TRINITY_DN22277_c0_g1_i1:75-1199(-)
MAVMDMRYVLLTILFVSRLSGSIRRNTEVDVSLTAGSLARRSKFNVAGARRSLDVVKSAYGAATAIDVKTNDEAKRKWLLVKAAILGANAAADELNLLIANQSGALKDIKNKTSSLSFSDLYDVNSIKLMWNASEDTLDAASSLQEANAIGKELSEYIESIKGLAGSKDEAFEADNNDTDKPYWNPEQPWYSNVWIHVKNYVKDLFKDFKIEVKGVDSVMNKLPNFVGKTVKPMIQPLLDFDFHGLPIEIKHKYIQNNSATISKNIVSLGDSVQNMSKFVDGTAKPYFMELKEVTASLKVDAESFEPGTIHRSKCAYRNIHVFQKQTDVDDTTMTCYSMVWKKVCHCVKRTDCFVEKHNRPAPADKVRCFTPAH